MKINTKYSLEQKVWFMYENKPKEATVESIDLNVSGHGTVAKYNLRSSPASTFRTMRESELFASKDELIDSLR